MLIKLLEHIRGIPDKSVDLDTAYMVYVADCIWLTKLDSQALIYMIEDEAGFAILLNMYRKIAQLSSK
jgi:hypothetical protein